MGFEKIINMIVRNLKAAIGEVKALLRELKSNVIILNLFARNWSLKQIFNRLPSNDASIGKLFIGFSIICSFFFIFSILFLYSVRYFFPANSGGGAWEDAIKYGWAYFTITFFLSIAPSFIIGLLYKKLPYLVGSANTYFPKLGVLSFTLFIIALIFIGNAFLIDIGLRDGWDSDSLYSEFINTGEPDRDCMVISLIISALASLVSILNFSGTILFLREKDLNPLLVIVWIIIFLFVFVYLPTVLYIIILCNSS